MRSPPGISISCRSRLVRVPRILRARPSTEGHRPNIAVAASPPNEYLRFRMNSRFFEARSNRHRRGAYWLNNEHIGRMPSSLDNFFEISNIAVFDWRCTDDILIADPSHMKRRVHEAKISPFKPDDWHRPYGLGAATRPIGGIEIEKYFAHCSIMSHLRLRSIHTTPQGFEAPSVGCRFGRLGHSSPDRCYRLCFWE
jgi:hypothetical protein